MSFMLTFVPRSPLSRINPKSNVVNKKICKQVKFALDFSQSTQDQSYQHFNRLSNLPSHSCRAPLKQFNIKDPVLVCRREEKRPVKWIPGRICKRLSQYLYLVRVSPSNTIRKVHINQLRISHLGNRLHPSMFAYLDDNSESRIDSEELNGQDRDQSEKATLDFSSGNSMSAQNQPRIGSSPRITCSRHCSKPPRQFSHSDYD